MQSIPSTVSIFLHMPPTEKRKGIDGLSGLVRGQFGADPLGGSLYLCVNRRGDRLKILHWDGTGFWVSYKVLEAGTIEKIVSGETCLKIDSTQLEMLNS